MLLLFVSLRMVCSTMQLDKTLLLKTADTEFDSFTGTIEIDSETYTASCDCSEQGLEDIEEVKCQPSKIKLTENINGEGATYEEIFELLENYNEFTWARVSRSSFRCLDGRIQEQMLGAPGGDAGEFLLGLIVYEGMMTDGLLQEDVDFILAEYLKCMQMPQFYMCTDRAALDHLVKELALDELDIYNPAKELQAHLLEALVDPNNQGDTHLRLLLEYPGLYSINQTVVEMFIVAYYKVLWDDENVLQSTVYLDVIEGSHEETAFLEIKTSVQCQLEEVAPLVAPVSGEGGFSVFISHLDVLRIRRKHTAHFFTVKLDNQDDFEATSLMVTRLNHYGLLFLDVTGSFIAKGLPFYTAEFV